MQVLIAIGMTATLLLLVSRVWLALDDVTMILPVWSPAAAGLGVLLGLGISGISAIAYRLWAAYRDSADYFLNLVLRPLALPDVLWLGVLPGLSEELLFRGVMLPAIGLNWFGVLVSSLCFGVLHFNGTRHWSYVVWASVIGATLGLVALSTSNLLIPIVAHTTTNLLSSWLWKFQHPPESADAGM